MSCRKMLPSIISHDGGGIADGKLCAGTEGEYRRRRMVYQTVARSSKILFLPAGGLKVLPAALRPHLL